MTLCVPMMTAMESQPDRRCDLDPAGEQPAPVRTRVLRNVDDGTAIFAADREALDQSQHDQRNPCSVTHAGIGGKEADQGRAASHHHDGDEEGIFSTDQIADAAEDHCADRPDHEAGRKSTERSKHGGGRVVRRKQYRAHEHGQRAVDEEVVPLKDGAEGRGENDLPLLAARQILVGGYRRRSCIHRHSPVCARGQTQPRFTQFYLVIYV
jgi:hypothetical protein